MNKTRSHPGFLFLFTWMRDIFASLVLAPLLISPAVGEPVPVSRIVIENTYTFHLSTNSTLHCSTEPYMIVKGHVAGMLDLRDLCRSTQREAAFLYSPQRRTWLNLVEGYREGASKHSVKTFTLVERFVNYRELGKEVYHVHIHPTFFVKGAVENVLNEDAMRYVLNGPNRKHLTRFCDAILVIPSFGDIQFYLQNHTRQGEVRINYQIVTEYGVTEVFLDYSNPQKADREYVNMWDDLSSKRYDMGLFDELKTHQAVVWFVNTHQDAVSLRFTPWSAPDG